MKLDRGQIHTWTDLVKAFLAQYDHVVDNAPDRMALTTMEKKATESFKEYTHRWWDTALQVQPSLMEKETTFIFVNTSPWTILWDDDRECHVEFCKNSMV